MSDHTMREQLENIVIGMPGNKTYGEIVDYFVANNVTVNQWIHVADKLPPNCEMVLTWNGATISMDFYDEASWSLGGKMRGLNITFIPVGSKITLADGVVNYHGTAASYKAALNFANMDQFAANSVDTTKKAGVLYNKVRAAIGNDIELTSQTYRNSPYTVFIKMGSLGGNDPSKMDAIKVYGQWGGTNIPDYATHAAGLALIPKGADAAPTT